MKQKDFFFKELAKNGGGRGLMVEAIVPVTDYTFNVLKFDKLIFANAVETHRSKRLKEKTGARYIEKRPEKFVNPSFKELELWELTKESWRTHSKILINHKYLKIFFNICPT